MTGSQPASGRGAAGRHGDRVRADARVEVEFRSAGGIELALTGDALEPSHREQVESALEQLGVTSATVAITNHRAPLFALLARVEAAVRLAWPGCPQRVLPPGPAWHGPQGGRDRLRRSRLYLAGNEPRFALKAAGCGSDGVILDLEDSVAPADKLAARILARNALRAVDFGGAERMVRINPGPAGLEDLAEIVPQGPELVLIPKAETGDQVRQIDAAIRQLAGERSIWLMPIVETAAGVLGAQEVARSSDRVAALAVGLEDLTADLGVPRTLEGEETRTACALVVLAAKAAGVQAIDTVFSRIDDPEGLTRSVLAAKAMGFEGKGCIHPSQVEPVNRAFAPTPEELARAEEIVAAYRKAEREGSGVVALGGRMIDAPVLKRALRIVALAGRETD